MAKLVMMPRTRTSVRSRSIDGKGCAYVFDEGTLRFDCQDCPGADDAPSDMCLAMFRGALEANPEATNILLLGAQDVWIKDRGVDSLRSLIAAENSWNEFCLAIRSLPCHHHLSSDRISRYLERCRGGQMDIFCPGEGSICQECVRRQELALDSLRSDRRRARRNVAADRFRIVEVPGGASR